MIDSVLNYARSELNTEVESKISLTDLLSAIVSDNVDRRELVALLGLEPQTAKGQNLSFFGKEKKDFKPKK